MQEQIKSLEERISKLEQKIETTQQYVRALAGYGQPHNPQKTSDQTEGPTKPPIPAKTKKTDSESASLILPLVAAICFVLAGVFIVRLAIDSGWLTAERQWGLLTLLGLTMTGLGRWFSKIDKEYRSYLSASGIVVLYIAAFSSSLYFQVVPETISLVMAMAVSGLCLMLFQYHETELFPILTSIGTYISPLLLGSKQDLVFDAIFFLNLALVFATIANYLRTRILSLTAAYFGIGVFTLLHAREIDPENLMIIIGVLVVQFFIFAYGVYDYAIRIKTPLSKQMALSYLPILLFFYGTTYYFIDRWVPYWAPWISLGLAAATYLLYRSASQQMQNLESQDMISAFLSVVLVHSGYLQILPDMAKPWLLPTFLLLGYIASNRNDFPKLAPVVKWAITAVGFIEFVKICFHLVIDSSLTSVMPSLVTLALGLFYYLKASRLIEDKVLLFLGLLHLLAILALYRIAFDHGSLAISLVWGVYSTAILVVGYQKKDQALAKSSLLVLLITSLKALIYDAINAPSMVRIMSLILTGAVLYGAGYLFKKIQAWKV